MEQKDVIAQLEKNGFCVEVKSAYVKVSGFGTVDFSDAGDKCNRVISVSPEMSLDKFAVRAVYQLYYMLNPYGQEEVVPLLMIAGDKAVFCDRSLGIIPCLVDFFDGTVIRFGFLLEGKVLELEKCIDLLIE